VAARTVVARVASSEPKWLLVQLASNQERLLLVKLLLVRLVLVLLLIMVLLLMQLSLLLQLAPKESVCSCSSLQCESKWLLLVKLLLVRLVLV
jgi:hypothetical protein